ncbi:DUF1559 domain-containing protein [Planctomicrobium piriforme]|uniref:DUF1559 domain-containing protein n=1 Tax=Planctomicrobium piriforme TaxID=1576369 RepID=A0A1I3AWH0_9PLAN|nr:DUF1559 domain-containing protein [Planctomicrobium piriforme]SFH54458.1 Protein of unknown function [Planctomicrobium piriforme]
MRLWPHHWVEYATLGLILAVLVALLLPVPNVPRGEARREQCKDNLKHIGLALHNYQEDYGSFPPAYTVDVQGNRLHSWRTLILPYLDQKPLYDKIDLNKPWDDPANAEVMSAQLAVYQCPSADLAPTQTTYLAFSGDDFCFAPTKGRAFTEITDGLPNTVMIFETDKSHAVGWGSPDDGGAELFLQCNDKTPQTHTGGSYVALADGSVRFVGMGVKLTEKTRKTLMTIAGGEELEEF